MATLIASAKLTNAFRFRVVDKNVSAAINSTSTFTATVFRTRRIVTDLESSSTLANTMRYSTKGGKGEFAVSSSLVCEFPTYIEIDIESLMLQGLPEGTDCVLNFQEGWMLEDRGRLLPSGAYEYGSNTQDAPAPEFPSFVAFRTPKFFRSAFSSLFTLPALGNFRLRFYTQVLALQNAFTPVMTARITRQGVTDLQSAFTAVIRAGEIVRLLSQANLFVVAGPIGPGSMPYLEGNGYNYPPGSPFEYLNASPPWTWPGILRIRQATATFTYASTASLTADVVNLPYIVPPVDYTSAFTMSANCDAFKGVGTPSLVATTSMSSSATVNYNSTVPTMQATTTVFCRTPQQANAALVAQSSVTADIGQSLELVWNAFGGDTIGIVFKGPNLSITCKWSDGVQTTISGGTINADIGGLPTYYYTRGVSATQTLTLRVTGSLSGFQFTRQGVDYINGEINSDDSYLGPAPTWAVAGRSQLIACNGWGDLGITDLNGAFANCTSLDTVPTFLPKNVTATACMFLNCVNMNDSAVLTWNTSTITTMAGMFRQASQFNQPIGGWNTSSVTRMSRMFRGGNSNNYPSTLRDSSFNQSLNGWDVTNVSRADMTQMFYFNELMAGNCNQWCVSHIATVPVNFASSTTTTWPTANRPIWGTCP